MRDVVRCVVLVAAAVLLVACTGSPSETSGTSETPHSAAVSTPTPDPHIHPLPPLRAVLPTAPAPENQSPTPCPSATGALNAADHSGATTACVVPAK